MNTLNSKSSSRLKWLLNRLFIWIPIQERRKHLSRQVDKYFNSTVAYGPFKGQKLTPKNWWDVKDRASMLLGIYEQEILHSLAGLPRNYTTFIDLGAADGYYAIGSLVSGQFNKAYCFEMSKKGRDVIQENANLNNVANKISIYGKADSDFYKNIPAEDLSSSVILFDIEGAEFDICTAELFEKLKKSVIFMEIHSIFFADGQQRYENLKKNAQAWFNLTELTTGPRDPSQFPELDGYEDTDRWLICSEGREKRMTWLRLDPKS